MNNQEQIIKIHECSILSKMVTHLPSVSAISLKTFNTKLLKLLSSEKYQLNIRYSPVIIALDIKSQGAGKNIFDSDFFVEFFQNGDVKVNNLILVDLNGNLVGNINPENYIIRNIEELNDSFPSSDLLFYFIENNSVDIVKDLKVIKVIADIFSTNQSRAFKNKLPISEYRTLITKHHLDVLKGQKCLFYWSNKSNRVLIDAPEKSFRKSLAVFLDDIVCDGKVDEESLNDNTDDRTDIRVTEMISENNYIIEVKWIGKCNSHSNYDAAKAHDRANEGIIQLENYVKTDPKCIKGVLVIYDARIKQEDIKWNPAPEKWNKVLDKLPFVLYLDSESASLKAKTAVKNIKNASN